MLYPLIDEVAKLFSKTKKPFWFGGGYSLDLLIGRKTREHEDLDFIINREDQIRCFSDMLISHLPNISSSKTVRIFLVASVIAKTVISSSFG